MPQHPDGKHGKGKAFLKGGMIGMIIHFMKKKKAKKKALKVKKK